MALDRLDRRQREGADRPAVLEDVYAGGRDLRGRRQVEQEAPLGCTDTADLGEMREPFGRVRAGRTG